MDVDTGFHMVFKRANERLPRTSRSGAHSRRASRPGKQAVNYPVKSLADRFSLCSSQPEKQWITETAGAKPQNGKGRGQ